MKVDVFTKITMMKRGAYIGFKCFKEMYNLCVSDLGLNEITLKLNGHNFISFFAQPFDAVANNYQATALLLTRK